MANPSKQKGTAFETLTVEYLKSRGIACERRALHGNTDKGDIAGVPDWTFELKNRKTLDIPGAIDEAQLEAHNAGTRWFAAIVKRPRKSDPAYAIAAMPLWALLDLIQELQPKRIGRGRPGGDNDANGFPLRRESETASEYQARIAGG